MTLTLGNATTSAITFVSTSATVQTVTWAGKTPGNITFNGAGGSWQIIDAWTAPATTVTLTTGTLSTNSQTCSWGGLTTSVISVRTLTLGSSSITLNNTSNAWESNGVTNLTVTANTATVTFTAGGARFGNVAFNFNGLSAVFSAAGAVALTGTGTATLANLTRTGTAAKTNSLGLAGDVVVTGAFAVTSDSDVNNILVQSNTPGTTRTITAGSVTFTNRVDFSDITGAGTATWTGGAALLGDAGGNSGITFAASVAQTHTASAGGNWSDATKWTSRVPLPQDDVVVDGNTTGTLTADMPRLGRNLTFTGFIGTAAFSSVTNAMYGSLTLASGMTISGTQVLTLAGRGSHTVTSAGKTLTQAVTHQGPGGTYTLQDAFTTAGNVIHNDGTLVDNGFAVTCAALNSISGRTRALTRTGAWSLTSAAATTVWSVTATGLTMTSTGASITIATTSANSRTFAGGGQTYGTLTYTVAGSTGALVITGANTFATINFSDATNARTLTLPASTTTTITGTFGVVGTAGKLMTLNSSVGGTAAMLSKASGTVNTDYLSIQDSTATGGAAWYAGANSTNVSNNTGWFFKAQNPPLTLAGTITPAGGLARFRIGSLVVAGQITPSALLLRVTGRLATGSVAPGGTAQRDSTKTATGSCAPSGSTVRGASRLADGSLAPVGAAVRVAERWLAGTVTPAGETVRTAGTNLAGTVGGVGSVERGTTRLADGTLSPGGALDTFRHAILVVAGLISPTSVLDTFRRAFLSVAGTVTPTGSAVREASKVISRVVMPDGTTLRSTTSTFAGSLTPTRTTQRTAFRLLAGVLTFVGTLIASPPSTARCLTVTDGPPADDLIVTDGLAC